MNQRDVDIHACFVPGSGQAEQRLWWLEQTKKEAC